MGSLPCALGVVVIPFYCLAHGMEVGLGANRAFDWERYVLFGFVRLAACWWTARAFFGEKCQADCQWSDLKDCLEVDGCDGWVHGSTLSLML